MTKTGLKYGLFLPILASILITAPYRAAAQIPHPSEVYGFAPGEDYKLATYDQMVEYYKRLDAASERVQLRVIGRSVLDKPLLLLFISTADNLRQMEHWREIGEKLARAQVDDNMARNLAREGKSIVWIDGGLHASEVAHAQMTSLLAHKVAAEETPEMQAIRENTILLLMPVMNPDGLDIIASWYKRNIGTPFETTSPPWLYHIYVGHDNNRDWFMNNMPESQAVTRVIYNEWFPQIVYNHHQTGPSWTRIFLPPFSDPVNPNIHPGVTTGVNLVGSAMANRFAMNKMPGVVSDVIYSMWWNGGMRTVPYFHNMIGILTETSHATPTPRFYDPDSLPKAIASSRGSGIPTDGTNIFYPYPWKGGKSSLKDPVDYMLTASMAVLRIATDLREHWLYSIYQMGSDAVQKGKTEKPYAYIIPPDQWNSGEEISLINILLIGGVEVHQADRDFEVGESRYQKGSYVVLASQAFRPYIMDLLEAQDYPDRRSSPNGAPEPPYDLAGWTLPMQMGVEVDRVDTLFKANLKRITGPIRPEPGEVRKESGIGYLFSHRPNASILAANRLMQSGEEVYAIPDSFEMNKRQYGSGTYMVTPSGEATTQKIAQLANELGIDFVGVKKGFNPGKIRMRLPRIGLYKSWVSNSDEGWTRWLLEEYAFPFDTLHDADIRNGDLGIYDAIILPHQSENRILNGHTPGTMPPEYTGGLGLEGASFLKAYVQEGGTLVALDGASDFAIRQFGLQVENAVSGVSSRQFFIPGSLVRLDVDADHPIAYGMQSEAAASFVRSRAFREVRLSRKGEGGLEDIPEGPRAPMKVIARYAKKDILMSGWALGEETYIGGRAAVVDVQLGEGNVVLFGFRPQFRGQPRGTYKLFFNALHQAATEEQTEGVAGSGGS